jgi:hypothetical protein
MYTQKNAKLNERRRRQPGPTESVRAPWMALTLSGILVYACRRLTANKVKKSNLEKNQKS